MSRIEVPSLYKIIFGNVVDSSFTEQASNKASDFFKEKNENQKK